MPLYFSAFDSPERVDVGGLMPEARPISSLSSGAAAVVICLHGFTGVPYEVAPAVEAISGSGPTRLAAVAPTLPAHGYGDLAQQHQAFAGLRYSDLLAAARAEIDRARQQYDQVGLFGFSMGGAIALIMAAEGRVDA
ncbi:MAG: alpha/beta fold hydrolase, partial [Cyanobacteria bacterium J06632_3]